jgi:hypothetical protein
MTDSHQKDPPEKPEPEQEGSLLVDLDAKTRAELSRWFGLPAVPQTTLVPAEDDEQALWRQRREAAAAACDPALVEQLYAWESRADAMTYDDGDSAALQQKYNRQSTVSGNFAATVVGGQVTDRETPFEVQANLRSCAPQALLRDLYRPQMFFPKEFEISPTRDQLPTDRLIAIQSMPPASESFLQTRQEIATSRLLLTQMYDVPWADLPLNRRQVKL